MELSHWDQLCLGGGEGLWLIDLEENRIRLDHRRIVLLLVWLHRRRFGMWSIDDRFRLRHFPVIYGAGKWQLYGREVNLKAQNYRTSQVVYYFVKMFTVHYFMRVYNVYEVYCMFASISLW